MNLILHKAVETDVDAITACVRRAYEKYVPLIGRLPNPMTTNYSRAVVEHQSLILTSHSGHLQAVLELVSILAICWLRMWPSIQSFNTKVWGIG